jgi:hypothetical protein
MCTFIADVSGGSSDICSGILGRPVQNRRLLYIQNACGGMLRSIDAILFAVIFFLFLARLNYIHHVLESKLTTLAFLF